MIKLIILKIKNELYIKRDPVGYARSMGVVVGERVKLISIKPGLGTFGSEPYLIEIGDDVTVAGGVQFLTHDGGVWVFNNKHNEMGDSENIDVCGRIKVESNVFIGYGAIVMPNVKIGRNAVIGAGAVVASDIPENSVAVGVPAKVIMSLQEYREKINTKCVRIRGLSYEEKKEYLLNNIAEAGI